VPFAEMGADAEVMEHFPARMSRADSDSFIDGVGADLEQRGWGLWAVEELSTGRFLGFTGLNVPGFDAPFLPATEIGWRLRRDAWGRGYATEAANGVLAVAFDDLELEELVSFTTVANTRSRAVMTRIGMVRDPADDFQHPTIAEGSPVRPHVLYRLRRPS
jgi:RimJ/RimL family protein N-acetyltransferase